ncbi:MAG: nicotinate phosphoribosyltransferase [Thermoproteota archaeon]|jgi:nicotinate phosphoribosyltransferase|uniref:Nicotinate phosphoribosyltransferase n=1 Tax=Candidatus Methanodesulfokora washburnensis TaxID=2478471 RepID=A0A3R9QDX7_9CREN|nr:nicotinate phosphoribosyltransferase [Candidatus Methanodesulfokores washburnensis]RSN74206.1 nicotinate phosphoribosyltransferase [Candidatus Methanodesulfokores washburnensis]TDA42183.1 MAG: nicotinate phosphoribosyltransferase [Candidatus Korarchaeota archaeon]
MRKFYVVSEDEIKQGKVTDVYFVRTMEVLKKKGLASKRVSMEISARSLPNNWSWGILAGVEEVLRLLEGRNVDVYTLLDGSLFEKEMPVARIEGPYEEFGELETSILGFLCSLSGVATAAAKVKMAAGEKPVINFGIRRNHPAISLAIERAGIIGGLDGSSGILVKELGIEPSGTMPHAMIILFGNQEDAWRAFDEIIPENVPRIALVDTFWDEKTESILAAETLGSRLNGVRLDTPGSRRGNMEEIIREVRWELDRRGFHNVKIFVSGGLNEETVKKFSEAGADAFGVGTRISGAKPVDFGMDIVEVEGKPISKRGILSGSKDLYICDEHLVYRFVPRGEHPPACPICREKMRYSYVKAMENGRITVDLRPAIEIREETKKILRKLRELGRGF